jgi:hypothetical protein
MTLRKPESGSLKDSEIFRKEFLFQPDRAVVTRVCCYLAVLGSLEVMYKIAQEFMYKTAHIFA